MAVLSSDVQCLGGRKALMTQIAGLWRGDIANLFTGRQLLASL